MKLSLGPSRLVLGLVLRLAVACNPRPVEQVSSGSIELSGIESGHFPVCVDGMDQPHGTFVVKNISPDPIAIDLTTTESLAATTTATLLVPDGTATVRAEMVGPFRPDRGDIPDADRQLGTSRPRRAEAGTVTIIDPTGFQLAGPFAGTITVDVRVLEIEELTWDARGAPILAIRNPTPFPTSARIASVGSWTYPAKDVAFAGDEVKAITLSVSGPALLPQGVAAEITIEGTRCSKADLPSAKVRIPTTPPTGKLMADPTRSK
jgi:hypothetical protein